VVIKLSHFQANGINTGIQQWWNRNPVDKTGLSNHNG